MKKLLIFSTIVILLLYSCTRDFDSFNNQYSGIKKEQLKADFNQLTSSFYQMQRNLANPVNWAYQLQSNLNADIYSGFFSTATPFEGGRNNSTYYMVDNWNERIMANQLEDVFQHLKNFMKFTKEEYPNVDFSQSFAILNILKVISTHRVSDVHGPVIYSKYFNPNPNGITDFDSQQDAYNYFIKDLSDAIVSLQKTPSLEDKTLITRPNSDIVFGGDTKKWARLANSLKLRLALRMAYVDNVNAKKYAEEALASSAGLIEEKTQNAFVSYGSGSPLYDIIYSWNDSKAGAPLVAYLKGFNDPRISSYVTKATDAAVNGQYIGVRQGIDLKGSKNTYGDFSSPAALAADADYFSRTDGKYKIVTAAEVWFLKAEAAIRGYAGAGDPETNYKNGVKASFEEWGKLSDYNDYINNNVLTEAPYSDPKNPDNNIPMGNPQLSTITIAWNNADSFERKLERIITQKWIALYPDGNEAWAEQRRTGYPILFKNKINDSNGTISTDAMIRRISVPNKYRNNTLNYSQFLQLLNGPDTGGTKLWWDKK